MQSLSPLTTRHIRTIKNNFFLMAIISMILAGFILYSYLANLISDKEARNIDERDSYVHRAVDIIIDELESDMQMASDLILNSKEVAEAVSRADRHRLLELVTPLYDLLKIDNAYLNIMTFRLKDGTALLRMHKPQMHGDMLHPDRKIILAVNQQHTVQKGFEVGKLDTTYRLVSPIFDNTAFIGTLEIGVDPEYIISQLKELTTIQNALLVNTERADGALKLDVLAEHSGYLMIKGDPVFREMLTKIDMTQPMQKIVYDGHIYVVGTDLDLHGYQNDINAKLLLAYDIDDLATERLNLLNDTFIFITLLMFIIVIIMRAGFNYFINRLSRVQEELHALNGSLEERVHAEVMKNREQEKYMLHQSRLAQMGELLSMIAHQWRQPLATISAIINKFKLKIELEDFDLATQKGRDQMHAYTQQSLNDIEQNLLGLSSTIDDFRAFYHTSREKTTVSLHEPIEKAYTLLEPSLKQRGIACDRNYYEPLKTEMFSNELTQVMMNLLQNAMEELTDHNIEGPKISIRTYTREDKGIIEVCDNGYGIEPAIAERIFEPYYSTKEGKNGSGLGLYMSKMIIEDHHNGTFELDQTQPRTCFVITLPLICY